MIQGIYSSSSGMALGMWRQARIAHNLANVNTVGYKQLQNSLSDFASQLEETLHADEDARRHGGAGVRIIAEETDWSQGPLRQTNRQLDVALTGPGFLQLATPSGDRYTRAGRFDLTPDGLLVTPDGHQVMGENGVIQLPEGEVTIHGDGQITVDGEDIDRLLLVEFADLEALERIGGTAFAAMPEAGLAAAAETHVLQGYLEGANVDLSREMANLIAVSRLYQTAQRLSLAQDEMLRQTVNDLGQI